MNDLKDFRVRLASGVETLSLKNHYEEIVRRNNALLNKGGLSRYIDWLVPFPVEILESAIERESLFIVGRTSEESSIYASFIFTDRPDRKIWQEKELPPGAIGFSKFGVSASLLGQSFGRTIAIPLMIDCAIQKSGAALYCDALPHLHSFYKSAGFHKQGEASFYWEEGDRTVVVDKHLLNL